MSGNRRSFMANVDPKTINFQEVKKRLENKVKAINSYRPESNTVDTYSSRNRARGNRDLNNQSNFSSAYPEDNFNRDFSEDNTRSSRGRDDRREDRPSRDREDRRDERSSRGRDDRRDERSSRGREDRRDDRSNRRFEDTRRQQEPSYEDNSNHYDRGYSHTAPAEFPEVNRPTPSAHRPLRTQDSSYYEEPQARRAEPSLSGSEYSLEQKIRDMQKQLELKQSLKDDNLKHLDALNENLAVKDLQSKINSFRQDNDLTRLKSSLHGVADKASETLLDNKLLSSKYFDIEKELLNIKSLNAETKDLLEKKISEEKFSNLQKEIMDLKYVSKGTSKSQEETSQPNILTALDKIASTVEKLQEKIDNRDTAELKTPIRDLSKQTEEVYSRQLSNTVDVKENPQVNIDITSVEKALNTLQHLLLDSSSNNASVMSNISSTLYKSSEKFVEALDTLKELMLHTSAIQSRSSDEFNNSMNENQLKTIETLDLLKNLITEKSNSNKDSVDNLSEVLSSGAREIIKEIEPLKHTIVALSDGNKKSLDYVASSIKDNSDKISRSFNSLKELVDYNHDKNKSELSTVYSNLKQDNQSIISSLEPLKASINTNAEKSDNIATTLKETNYKLNSSLESLKDHISQESVSNKHSVEALAGLVKQSSHDAQNAIMPVVNLVTKVSDHHDNKLAELSNKIDKNSSLMENSVDSLGNSISTEAKNSRLALQAVSEALKESAANLSQSISPIKDLILESNSRNHDEIASIKESNNKIALSLDGMSQKIKNIEASDSTNKLVEISDLLGKSVRLMEESTNSIEDKITSKVQSLLESNNAVQANQYKELMSAALSKVFEEINTLKEAKANLSTEDKEIIKSTLAEIKETNASRDSKMVEDVYGLLNEINHRNLILNDMYVKEIASTEKDTLKSDILEDISKELNKLVEQYNKNEATNSKLTNSIVSLANKIAEDQKIIKQASTESMSSIERGVKSVSNTINHFATSYSSLLAQPEVKKEQNTVNVIEQQTAKKEDESSKESANVKESSQQTIIPPVTPVITNQEKEVKENSSKNASSSSLEKKESTVDVEASMEIINKSINEKMSN